MYAQIAISESGVSLVCWLKAESANFGPVYCKVLNQGGTTNGNSFLVSTLENAGEYFEPKKSPLLVTAASNNVFMVIVWHIGSYFASKVSVDPNSATPGTVEWRDLQVAENSDRFKEVSIAVGNDGVSVVSDLAAHHTRAQVINSDGTKRGSAVEIETSSTTKEYFGVDVQLFNNDKHIVFATSDKTNGIVNLGSLIMQRLVDWHCNLKLGANYMC